MARVPNAVEILRKIWTTWVGCTSITDRQTDDRRDGRQHIANVNVSSRSLKTETGSQCEICWVYHAGALKISTGKFFEADALLTMPLTKSLNLPEVQPLMSVQCYLTLNKWQGKTLSWLSPTKRLDCSDMELCSVTDSQWQNANSVDPVPNVIHQCLDVARLLSSQLWWRLFQQLLHMERQRHHRLPTWRHFLLHLLLNIITHQ